MNRTNYAKLSPYFLGFRCETREHRAWIAQPSIPYRAQGLLIWGADTTSLIHRFQYGAIEALRASTEPIPALTFACGYSFEEFAKLVEDDTASVVSIYREGILKTIPRHFPWHQIHGLTLAYGETWSFETSGPIAAVVSWGWGDILP